MRSLRICVSILFVSSKTSFCINPPQVILQWTNESCIGGERGLLSTGLWFSLKENNEMGIICSSNRQLMIEYNSSLPALDFYLANCSAISNATFKFEQPEHGGGLCHCVRINFTNTTDTFR